MPTTVGLLHLEVQLPQAQSLKDKRRSIKSFKDKMAHGYNVSIAEVYRLDSVRWGVLAVAAVGNDKTFLEGTLQRIVNAATAYRDMILVGHEIQWL